jgi:hypothetical protein
MKQLNKEDLEKLPHKFQIMFAVFCAKQVFHLIDEKDKSVCLKAIEAAEGFIDGTVSREQAYAAANAAAYAINAAAYAVYAVANNKEEIIKEQWEYYNELLNFEKNFEEIMLEVI